MSQLTSNPVRFTVSEYLRMSEAGIADYWVVNLRDKRVEIYRKPENPTGKKSDWRYASVKHLAIGETVAVLKRPKVRFDVEAMLP